MTAFDPWGSAPSSPGMSSSLGTASTPWAVPQQVGPTLQKPSGGSSGFWGSWTNPLGLVGFVKNLATGLGSQIGQFDSSVYNGVGDVVKNTAADVAGGVLGVHTNHQDWSDVGTQARQAGQVAGDFATGLGTGLEQLSVSAGATVGLGNVLRDDVYRPFNHWLAHGGFQAGGFGGGALQGLTLPLGASFMSDEMKAQLDAQGKGYGPQSFMSMAHQQGVGAAFLTTAAEASIVAGPVAGAASAAAGDASAAAAEASAAAATADAGSAAEADALSRAATYQARADLAAKIAGVAGGVGKVGRYGYNPVGAVAEALTGPLGELGTPEVGADPNLIQRIMGGASTGAEFINHPIVGANGVLNYLGLQTTGLTKAAWAGVHPADLPVQAPDGTLVPAEEAGAQTGTQTASGQSTGGAGYATPEMVQMARDAMTAHAAAAEQLGSYQDSTIPADQLTSNVEPAPGVEPQVEPNRYSVRKGQPAMTADEAAAKEDAVRAEAAAARDKYTPRMTAVDRIGQRIQLPPPDWATNLVSHLDPRIARILAKPYSWETELSARNLERNLTQFLETTQSYASNSPAQMAARTVIEQLLSDTVGRPAASDMVGQELHARLNGELALARRINDLSGFQPTPEDRARILAAVRGDYTGITDEVLQQIGPEKAAKVQEALNQAAEAYKKDSAEATKVLLAGRFGGKGLERVILNPDDLMMTPKQVRDYDLALRYQRMAELADARGPNEREVARGVASRAASMAERDWDVVDQLRMKRGLNESTIADLRRGVPDGMRNDSAPAVNTGMTGFGNDGWLVLDPAANTANGDLAGHLVIISPQGAPIQLADWAAQGAEALKNAIQFPMNPSGGTYEDPVGLYTGMDARVIVTPVGDGTVQVSIGMHSINGEPMQPWQSSILGPAHGAPTVLDLASGSEIPVSVDPTFQTVARHYMNDVMNPESQFSKSMQSQWDTSQQVSNPISADKFNADVHLLMHMDQIMAQRPNRWVTGDLFKTEMAFKQGEPQVAYLAQTIMPEMGVADHFIAALQSSDVQSVNKMLEWYYRSNAVIEQLYRYNPDGTVKMMPYGGRPVADVAYDMLASMSVMASPTQNLGRMLAGFDNLDTFLRGREDALTDMQKVMDELVANKKAETVYVRNLGVMREDYVRDKLPQWKEEHPQKASESDADYKKRVNKQIRASIETQYTSSGEGRTAVSRRWLDSPVARQLTDQTSMTTSPKYRIIDLMTDRFRLQGATAEDIGRQPEYWFGSGDHYSDVKLTPEAVLYHAALLKLEGPAIDAYRQWALDHAKLTEAAAVRQEPGYVAPITNNEDVQRQRAQVEADQKGVPLLGGREVSPSEYQALANDGREYVKDNLARSEQHVLDTPESRQAAWDALHPTQAQRDAGVWPGATFDAHTGEPIPGDYKGDTYAVSAKLPKELMGKETAMKTVTAPLDATPAQFDKAYTEALKRFELVLNSQGGHLGIFENQDTGKNGQIEFDPVYHTQNIHDTESVGAYTHAHGGAYNFATEYGYWIPHVEDSLAWSAKSGENGPQRDVAASVIQGRALAQHPDVRTAYENALMEYHGSGLLAKLRSFADNLRNPHESLAVTLDSIMAQLFGIHGTPWARKGEYATYAQQIRDVADTWSQLAGHTVMPHEVQAVLWVYAKSYIGEQDWGRWQNHLISAKRSVDEMAQIVADGGKLNIHPQLDLLSQPWRQETQFSEDQLGVRNERTPLREAKTAADNGKGPALTADQQARLDYLEKVPTRQRAMVRIVTRDGTEMVQPRDETYFDKNTLSGKRDQYVKYLETVARPVRDALSEGRFEDAKKMLEQYVERRQQSMLQGIDGKDFQEVMQGQLDAAQGGKVSNVTAERVPKLMNSQHIPPPNTDGLTMGDLLSSFKDRVRGAMLEQRYPMAQIMMRLYQSADFTTLLHENLHALRQMLPGDDMAELSQVPEYAHLQDATMTPERKVAEEKFVEDLFAFMYERARAGDPRLSPAMRSQAQYRGPSFEAFNNIADAIDQFARAADNTQGGHSLAPQIRTYWDNLFNQHILEPDVFHDPLSLQYNPDTAKLNPDQLRGESDFNYRQRLRQYGEARQRDETIGRMEAQKTRQADAATKWANKMEGQLLEPTKSEFQAARLRSKARGITDRLAGQLENPDRSQIPTPMRGYFDAIGRLRDMATNDPSMQPILDEIGTNWSRALELATQIGFDPTHMPDMTWDMVRRFMYGHLTLGQNAEEASMRKLNKNVYNSRGLADRSVEALGVGTVVAMRELMQSKLVSFVEENWARQWRAGVAIPDGWHGWSATRDAVLTGHNVSGERVPVYDTMIVPNAVHDTIEAMANKPVDMPFRFLFKGPAVTVWKNLLLTYSPTWYMKHLIGSVTLATLEGVRLQDWRKVWDQWRKNGEGELPYAAMRRPGDMMTNTEVRTPGGFVPRPLSDLPDIIKSEGYRQAAHEVNQKLKNIVNTVDKLSRAAVFAKTERTTGDLSLALTRSFEAIGDFGRLGPLERGAVSQLLPFYSFQKAMFRLLMRLPLDHPYVALAAIMLGNMHQQYLKDKLGGAVPDAYLGAQFINGHLTPLDKLNPLTDSYKLLTPDGLAASLNPFASIFAKQAFGAAGFGSGAGMSSTGGLVNTPDAFGTLKDMYTGGIPGLGSGPGKFSVVSGLSDTQYAALQKRIAKTLTAEQTVAKGGYLVTDANAGKQVATTTNAFGNATASTTGGSRVTGRAVSATKVPRVRTAKVRAVRAPHFRTSSGRGFHLPKVRAIRATHLRASRRLTG